MPILVQRTSRRRQWIGVAVMAAFIAGGYWISRPDPVPALPDGSGTAQDSRSFSEVLASAVPASAAASTVPAAPADAVPEGLTAQEWKDLQEALKDHPQRDAELARVADFMGYQARLDRFRQLAAQPALAQAPDTRELARTLLEQLPLHVRNAEVGGGEAAAIAESLLASIHPDAAERERQRSAMRELLAQAAAAPAPALAQQTERAARYASAEAAELARWNEAPPDQRDPRELEARLEALRRAIFDEATPPTGGSR